VRSSGASWGRLCFARGYTEPDVQGQTSADCGKVLGVGIIGAIAAMAGAAAVVLLPAIFGFFIEAASSGLDVARIALALVVASLSSWVMHLSFGSILLACIVATTVSGVVGGFIGAFLGCISATVVLERNRLQP